MAELDAINYYLQQGKLFSDEKLKKVHDDIAREEITHFGEFLRLLYLLNKEEFNYIVKGWNEASKLIGDQETFPIPLEVKERSEPKSEGGNPGRNGEVSDQVMRYLNEGLSSRRIREIGNVVNYPKNSVTVYDLIEEKEGITQGENSTLYPLPRLKETVKVRFDADPVSASNALVSAGALYARKEDSLLLTEHPLSPTKRSTKQRVTDWTVPGNIALDIVKAIETLYSSGYSKGIYAVVPPGTYSMLHRVVDKTGTLEIELIKSTVNLVISEQVKDHILVTAKPGFFILESTPVTVDYLGREGTNEVYMIWGRLAPYVLDSRAVVLIGPGD